MITLHFDQHHTVGCGLARSKNVIIPEEMLSGEYHEHWHWLKQFEYSAIHSEEEANSLIAEIGIAIFDEQYAGSVASMLKAATEAVNSARG